MTRECGIRWASKHTGRSESTVGLAGHGTRKISTASRVCTAATLNVHLIK